MRIVEVVSYSVVKVVKSMKVVKRSMPSTFSFGVKKAWFSIDYLVRP